MFEIVEMMWVFTPEEIRYIILGGIVTTTLMYLKETDS